MSNIKWIKLVPDWYNHSKIKQLKTMPERFALTTIWFSLLGLAGIANNSGKLTLGKISYDKKMLANEFDIPEHLIELGITVFKKLEMIEILEEEDCLFITNWVKHQNIDGMERIREQNRIRFNNYYKRKKEEVKAIENKSEIDKLNISNVRTNVILTQSNATDIDIDKELDIDKDKYLKKEKIYIAKEKKEKPILTPEELTKVKDIISFLNNTCFKKFNYDTKETQRLLKPILKQYDVELIKKTIAHKNEQWGGDDKMKPFLRPSTLFNFNHFESYYNELPYEVRNPEL